MHSTAPSSRHGDGQLWLIAFGLSMLANAAILVTVGFAAVEAERLRAKSPPPVTPAGQTVAMIFPEMVEPNQGAAATQAGTSAAAPPLTLAGTGFARTSDDQLAARPERPMFIGERNTQATSDRPPDPSAPPLPSQAGITPYDATHLETTESRYQDGPLDAATATAAESETPPSPPVPESPPMPEPSPAKPVAATDPADPSEPDEAAPVPATPPARGDLLEGPLPVEVPVPRAVASKRATETPPEPRQETATPAAKAADPPKAVQVPKPKPDQTPGFKGNQRKTAVVGSISRTGRSAVDVEDSPLGRYQAALSRAVELEWQRNCVRHRDFITPGFLTVRFFVEPGGKVRSVQFVGDMSTGEVQKGFTLNSIRDAAIPPMPQALRKDYDKEPLELIFRFYF